MSLKINIITNETDAPINEFMMELARHNQIALQHYLSERAQVLIAQMPKDQNLHHLSIPSTLLSSSFAQLIAMTYHLAEIDPEGNGAAVGLSILDELINHIEECRRQIRKLYPCQ